MKNAFSLVYTPQADNRLVTIWERYRISLPFRMNTTASIAWWIFILSPLWKARNPFGEIFTKSYLTGWPPVLTKKFEYYNISVGDISIYGITAHDILGDIYENPG
jgi:hypothetical protein